MSMVTESNGSLIAVVDVETTGLFPFRHDRVVEVAVVVAGTDGRIVREFVSLVNPQRDIGPSSVHGLTSADILNAPTFASLAPMLLSVFNGTVAIAGHNIRFDRQFLECEFSRLDQAWPDCQSLCTMELAGGGRLKSCCDDYGIQFNGNAHCALVDARATAQLLGCLLKDSPSVVREVSQLPQIAWPVLPDAACKPLTREASRRCQAQPPGYLQRLLDRLSAEPLPVDFDSASLAYSALLDRAVEDRQIDDCEGEALLEMATQWGMSRSQVQYVHRCYVDRLAVAALSDGVVSDAERKDLHLVCRLLGDGRNNLDGILNEAASSLKKTGASTPSVSASRELSSGMRVCFTGEMSCVYCGKPITREVAEELAKGAGMEVVDSVTKKLDMLVVADPNTQSGKAKKARQYGIRVLHEPVFWSAIGVQVS